MCVLLCRGVIAQRSVYPALDSWALTLLCRGSCLPRRLSKYSTVQSRMHCARKLAQIPGCNSWCPCFPWKHILPDIFFRNQFSCSQVIACDYWFKISGKLWLVHCRKGAEAVVACLHLSLLSWVKQIRFLLWLRCGENTQIKAGSW